MNALSVIELIVVSICFAAALYCNGWAAAHRIRTLQRRCKEQVR